MYISTYYEQKFRMMIKQCSRYIKNHSMKFLSYILLLHPTFYYQYVCVRVHYNGITTQSVDWYIPGSLVGNHFSMARCL